MVHLPHLTARASHGLTVLGDAATYADELGCDAWQFALELTELQSYGITSSDLRWLMAKGLVDHAKEVTSPQDRERVFQPRRGHLLSAGSCFVLSNAGREILEESKGLISVTVAAETVHAGQEGNEPHRPTWDSDRLELRVGENVVKRFKSPATNQEAVLAAFEEEEWPPRIDDPLPPRPGQEPKRRLHDTINSLNRHQICEMIRFQGDGRGQGIRWVFNEPAA